MTGLVFRELGNFIGRRLFLALATIAFAAPMPAQASLNDSQLEAYYAIRLSPIWFANGAPTPAARALAPILRRAQLDGLPDGPVLATQVESAMQAVSLSPTSAMQMDRVLSSAWVRYVYVLQAPIPGVEYGDKPKTETPAEILAHAAQKQTQQLQHILTVASVNPIYAELRDALWNQTQTSGSRPSAIALANIARVRMLAPSGKYIIIDVRAAKLFMFDEGGLADSMRVIVGKRETQTPLVVSKIYQLTLNPYWNVPANLVRSLVAARVLAQGASYLRGHTYQVLTKYGLDGSELPAESINWKAVADGKADAAVRQQPGPANSMGRLKIWFSNSKDVYLHDTPNKALFEEDNRLLSNGCIRLEDAQRLGRWLLGRDPHTDSTSPDENVLLPLPVPVYVTYLTMQADQGTLKFVVDAYGMDPVADALALTSQ